MKAELKQKWIEALRGGKYEQGRMVLHDTDTNTFCCLGVLCDVAGEPIDRFSLWATLDGYGKKDLVDSTGTVFRHELAAMNDNGKSFAEIADWIDANLPADEARDPNYCSTCTPAGIGYCRCEIAANE